MKKVRARLITILSLFLLIALLVGAAIGLTGPGTTAAAKSFSPSTLFWANAGGEVGASSTESDGEQSYIEFLFRDGGSVEYHRDLALKWFEAAKPEDTETVGGEANPGAARYFSFSFAFGNLSFETFEIVFESAEENVTEEGKSTNSLVFKHEENSLKVAVKNAEMQEREDADLAYATITENASSFTDDITVSMIKGATFGSFGIRIVAGEDDVELNGAAFTNIGGNYMEYRSSGSTSPNMPLLFSAELPAVAEGEEQEQFSVLAKSLNGQSLALTDGQVVDDTPAVLVLNEDFYGFTLGQRFSLTYEAIDVCDDSVVPSRTYYMLKKDDEGQWHKPNETTQDDYITLTTNVLFLPPDDSLPEPGEEELREYVSVRFFLDDERDVPSEERTYVYLSWYAADSSDEIVRTIGNDAEDRFDYILVDSAERKSGPEYTGLTATADPSGEGGTNVPDAAFQDAVEKYEKAVVDASKDLSAGTGAYFYLPSFRRLISSNYADYRNLRFSIYYYKPGSTTLSSETSLRYNNLRFQIDKKGWYTFKVFATDASSNAMKLYYDGKLVTVDGSNVMEIDDIPSFSFEVGYTGAVIKEAGRQTVGYRGSTYNVQDFDIVALDNCEKEYTLYRFDESLLPEGETRPSYGDFVENVDEYVAQYEEYLQEIDPYNDEIDEDDPDWSNTMNEYYWRPSSRSFVPCKSGIYVVRLTHFDPNCDSGKETTAYQVIEIRNPVDYIPGQTNWFRNNVTSVVLFSIAAVLAIAIVVLFVVKPSDKKLEEVDLEKLKGKKRKK